MEKVLDTTDAGSAGRAAVTPRVRAWPTGEVLPLEYHIDGMIQRSVRVAVGLFGPPGSGKSTALRHLKAVFADKVTIVDDAVDMQIGGRGGVVVFASVERRATAGVSLEMAAWENDDVIEYLLHKDRLRCRSVMTRVLTAEGPDRLRGLPELWAAVLDEFLRDEALMDFTEALLRHARRPLDPVIYDEAAFQCLKSIMEAGSYSVFRLVGNDPGRNFLRRFFRHHIVGFAMASEKLVHELAIGEMRWLARPTPREVIRGAGQRIKRESLVARGIEKSAREVPIHQPTGVSLLLAADAAWRPAEWKIIELSQAYATGAHWRGIDLSRCQMQGVDLSGADLIECNLDGAIAKGANLRRSKLIAARLNRCLLSEANLGGADLSRVEADAIDLEMTNLEGASLRESSLQRAMLDRAEMKGAHCKSAKMCGASLIGTKMECADFSDVDFSDALLGELQMREACFRGASFRRARLRRCDLSYLELPMADFEGANLNGSYLTGTVMREANLRGADLRSTGLAEVDWEGSDLRDADFTRASFHMGSSRSGLVKSDIASEGTRTGFYTDDYNDQDFKAPEEIRKANLCGCDLRGAKVELTDFYLVDLRGAKYSEHQRQHFANCGAILRTRG